VTVVGDSCRWQLLVTVVSHGYNLKDDEKEDTI